MNKTKVVDDSSLSRACTSYYTPSPIARPGTAVPSARFHVIGVKDILVEVVVEKGTTKSGRTVLRRERFDTRAFAESIRLGCRKKGGCRWRLWEIAEICSGGQEGDDCVIIVVTRSSLSNIAIFIFPHLLPSCSRYLISNSRIISPALFEIVKAGDATWSLTSLFSSHPSIHSSVTSTSQQQ